MEKEFRNYNPEQEAKAMLDEGNNTLRNGLVLCVIGLVTLAGGAVSADKSSELTVSLGAVSVGTFASGTLLISQGEKLIEAALEKAQDLGHKVNKNLLRGKIIPS